jgi:hypothetical protein
MSLTLITFIVVFLYVWNNTDAAVEWTELFRLRFMKYKEYRVAHKDFPQLYPFYVDYLELKHSNFFTRLICCPICFSVWLNILSICVFYTWTGWKNLALNIIITWIMYFGLKRLITKLNA